MFEIFHDVQSLAIVWMFDRRRAEMDPQAEVGLDPKQALTALLAEREKIDAAADGVAGPVRGFVVPTLRSIGMFSDRIEGHFRQMFVANFGEERARSMNLHHELPRDLDAWLEGGGRNLPAD